MDKGETMKYQYDIIAFWAFLLTWSCGMTPSSAQNGGLPVTYDSIAAGKNAELQNFINRKKAIEQQPASQQRDLQLKTEIQRHQAETKKLSVQEQSLRTKTVSDLKQKWNNVENDWKAECERHNTAREKLENLPEGPERTAKIEAEAANHRANSKKIAVDRNAVHEGVMEQANREVNGGSKGVSNEMKQTAGTKVNDPNHRGMNGDCDAGGGYRTTEKAAKILNEMEVKGPGGKSVEIKNGVLETSGDFGMTVNADPGLDRVGSSGHQAQTKQSATNKETYVSEQAGAVKSQTLKDHLATLDNTKKANSGLNENPEALVGKTPEAQGMVKGAVKAAGNANLPQETLDAIAQKNGFKDSEAMLDKMAEIKTGNGTIKNTAEATKLQNASKDLINASENATKTKAKAEVEQMKQQIADHEAKGNTQEAQKLREELADYKAKATESNKALANSEKPGTGTGKELGPTSETPKGESPKGETPGTAADQKPGSGKAGEPAVAGERAGPKIKAPREPATKPGNISEPEAPKAAGGKLMQGAGLALLGYGIYEGYNTAVAEMEAKKQGETQGVTGWTANKAELAGRTLWHGLGFGGMAEIGSQAGKESYEQYKKDIAEGKVSPDSWASYGWMKTRAVLGGFYGGVKAMTYDTAKNTGTSLGEAGGEGLGIIKDVYGWYNSSKNLNQSAEERSKKIYDTLIKNGASTVGAQLAADGVLQGNFTEAKRLGKILEEKQAAKLAAQKQGDRDIVNQPADLSKAKGELTKNGVGKDTLKSKPDDKEKPNWPVDPTKTKTNLAKTTPGKNDLKNKGTVENDAAKVAADAQKEEEAKVKAALAEKEKAIALLADGIAKTRSAIAQIRAVGAKDAPIGDLVAILAIMEKRYKELTGGPFKGNPKGPNGKPVAKIDTPQEGGTIIHSDGSKSVLTYGKDAAGNKVPITTDYDKNGKVLKKMTVDSKGKSVPVR